MWALWLAIDPSALGTREDGLHECRGSGERHLGATIAQLGSALTRSLVIVAAHDLLSLGPVWELNVDVIGLTSHSVLDDMDGVDSGGLRIVLHDGLLAKSDEDLVDADVEWVLCMLVLVELEENQWNDSRAEY